MPLTMSDIPAPVLDAIARRGAVSRALVEVIKEQQQKEKRDDGV